MSSSEFELTRSESTTQLWQQGKQEKFQENDQEQSSSSQQPSYPQQQHSYPPQPYPPQSYPSQSYPPQPYPPQPYPPQPYHPQQSYPPQPHYYSQPPPQQQQQAVVYNSQDDSCSNCSKSMVDCINSYSGITTMSYTMDCITGGKYFPPVVGIYNTNIVPDGGAVTSSSSSSPSSATTSRPPALPLPDSKFERLRLTPASPEWGSLSFANQTALIGTRRKYGVLMFVLMLAALVLLAAAGATNWLVISINMGESGGNSESFSIFINCWNAFGPNICETGPNEVQLIIPFMFCCAFVLGTVIYTFVIFRQSFGAVFVPIGGVGGFATILATVILFNQQAATYEPDANSFHYEYYTTDYKTGPTMAYCVIAFTVLVTLISLRLVQLEASILFKAPKTRQEEEEEDDDLLVV